MNEFGQRVRSQDNPICKLDGEVERADYRLVGDFERIEEEVWECRERRKKEYELWARLRGKK